MQTTLVRYSICCLLVACLPTLTAGCSKTPASSIEAAHVEGEQESAADEPLDAVDSPGSPDAVVAPEADQATKGTPSAKPQGAAKQIRRKRSRRAVEATGPRSITFDDIKFEMEKGGAFDRKLLTPTINELAGQTISIRGYILPTNVFQETDVDSFILVRDNQECCFGPGAMLYDCIVVQMNAGKTTKFTNGVVAVEGKFSIDEQIGGNGLHEAIYRLDADSAK